MRTVPPRVPHLVDAPPTLAERVDGRLRSAILTGELAQGTKLRSEHLAAEWGVSATPIREAFQRLAGEGLVVIEPQRGARVSVVDAADAVELYELRLVVDPEALRASMAAATRGDVDEYRTEISDAFDALNVRHRSVAAFLERHRRFHLALLSRCPNQRMLALATQLHDHSQRSQVAASGPARGSDPRVEHAELADAVIAGDVRAATKLLAGHLRATLDAIRATVP